LTRHEVVPVTATAVSLIVRCHCSVRLATCFTCFTAPVSSHHPGKGRAIMHARDGRRLIDSPRRVQLADYDPGDTGDLAKADAKGELATLEGRLQRLQELLYASAHQGVLIVLQGLDTAGKDGTVKHVMASVNPTGCQVWSFKVPTPDELAHDFLWRVHLRTPGRGVLTIFNRSHYEDVLVTRVHRQIPRHVWEARFEQINTFERSLVENDTVILKFFLHISKDEQERRLLARERDPRDAWKLSVADWRERDYWHAYQEAYEDVLSACATKHAPWYIVPANKKWYRNVFIARAIVERLEEHAHAWEEELAARGRVALAEIRAAHVRDEPADGEAPAE
jgi:PPK2 family polyphosphate:nucleotide phosphotransferase